LLVIWECIAPHPTAPIHPQEAAMVDIAVIVIVVAALLFFSILSFAGMVNGRV
jgi:hypothetical protein